MLQQCVDISIPFGEILTHPVQIIPSDEFCIIEIFLLLFLADDIFDFWIYLYLDLRNCDCFLALCDTEVEFVHLPHNVVEVVFVGCRFLFQLVFVETQNRHHQFVDILIGHVEDVGLILEIEVHHLQHPCYLVCGDVLVEAEVVALDDEDVGGGQHIARPLHFQFHFLLCDLLHYHKTERVVTGEVGDDLVVAFPLQLGQELALLEAQEHPEAGEIPLEGGEVLLVDG